MDINILGGLRYVYAWRRRNAIENFSTPRTRRSEWRGDNRYVCTTKVLLVVVRLIVDNGPFLDMQAAVECAAACCAEHAAVAFRDAVFARAAVGGLVVALVRRIVLFARRLVAF